MSKVLVLIEENHSYRQMKRAMPFLAMLSDRYGFARHWTALSHPSLPNYLGIVAGSTFHIQDDGAPDAHVPDIGSATTVFDQAQSHDKSAAAYAESMPGNCKAGDSPSGPVSRTVYAVQVNPWAYFPVDRRACTAHDTPLKTFAAHATHNSLPNIGFLIPDLQHDAHNGTLHAADAWLHRQLAPVLGSRDFASGRLVVVVTADEDNRHSDNRVLTSILTPHLSHQVVDTALTHYSLTRYIDEVLGARPLRNAADAPDMGAAFGLCGGAAGARTPGFPCRGSSYGAEPQSRRQRQAS